MKYANEIQVTEFTFLSIKKKMNQKIPMYQKVTLGLKMICLSNCLIKKTTLDPEPSIDFIKAIDTNLILGVVGIVGLLFCSAMVSASEVALFSLSQKDMDNALAENATKSQLISKLLEKPKKLLATILVTNNFMNIGVVMLFSYIMDTIFGKHETFELSRFLIEVGVDTFLILLFAEVLPKIYASRNNLKFSYFVAYPLTILDKILSPISIPMRSITIFLHNKLGKQKQIFQ